MSNPTSIVRTWNFDIDHYLNPFIPPPPRSHLPRWILHFLGYRDQQQSPSPSPSSPPPQRHRHHHHHEQQQTQCDRPDAKQPPPPPPPPGNILAMAWAFLGSLASLSLIYLLGQVIPLFHNHVHGNAPVILGSFGAAAVLEFHSLASPLAQPRNALVGHLLSTVVGVSLSSASSALSPPSSLSSSSSPTFPRWLLGALSTSLSIALMALTKTTHPPAGATALLAVIDPNIAAMRWTLVPFVAVSGVAMLAVACVVNNLQGRTFPSYWWTDSSEVGGAWRKMPSACCRGWRSITSRTRPNPDPTRPNPDPTRWAEVGGRGRGQGRDKEEERSVVSELGPWTEEGRLSQATRELEEQKNPARQQEADKEQGLMVTVSSRGIVMPPYVYLRPEERALLDELVKRL